MRTFSPDLRRRLALLSASGLTAPAVALAQGLPAENVLLQQSTGLPIAKTWYVDEDGNFVLITQQQLVELAQAPALGTPLQALSSAGSEGVTIPAGMFNQIIMYSAGIGGLAGGALVGGLMLATSGDGGSDITVSSGSSGNSNSGGVKNATISVVDDAIARGETGGEITYTLNDIDGIDESDLVASLNAAVGGASTIASIFPNGVTTTTHDQSGLVSGSADTYTSIGFTLTGDVAEALNLGTFPGPEISFSDAANNQEIVNLQLTIAAPSLTLVVDGGATGSTVSGSIGDDTITINTMPNQGTVSALNGGDTIHLYDVITYGETIDGGADSDNLQLYTNVTAGSITNIERVDIRTTALVDLDHFSGVSDLNIETTNVVTIDKLMTQQVDAVADAKVVIEDMASGNQASFDAGGNLTIESQDASLSYLTVDMASGSTLTLTADGTNDAIIDLTLSSTGNLTLEGNHASALRSVNVSNVTGDVTATANAFTSLTNYQGADGVDTVLVSETLTNDLHLDLNDGDDVVTINGSSNDISIDGGAGKDNIWLTTGARDTVEIQVNQLQHLVISAIDGVAALETAISNGAFEIVSGFKTSDEFRIDQDALTGISTVQTTIADAYTELATNDVVLLSENGADFDIDTFTDDYFIIIDTAGDHSAVGMFKIDSAPITPSDIDIF